MVHASMSMVPEAVCVCCGAGCCCSGGGGGEADTLGGGGTALYLPYAMIGAEMRGMASRAAALIRTIKVFMPNYVWQPPL